jgi:choline dehydrogenase-like flavoprotein
MLKSTPNIRVILNSTVLELVPAADHRHDQTVKRVAGVRATDLSGKTFTVSAKSTVLAAGGIENARLLLLSDKVHQTGTGNEHDLVGRYFLDHVWVRYISYLHFAQRGLNLPFYFDTTKLTGGKVLATVAPDPSLLKQEGIGNFRVWLYPSSVSSEGSESAHEMMDALKHGSLPKHFFRDLGGMLANLDVLADNVYKTITGSKVGFIQGNKAAPYDGAWLDLNIEQRPNRDSRVLLGTERDALGQRRVQLDWRLTESDRRTAARAFDIAAHEFGRLGLGRTRTSFDLTKTTGWPTTMVGSDHYSGTTRMSDDPKSGVVDRNCRVHSVANLYVAGSSVFPTNGYANPTLTIVALALRLADHIGSSLA